MSSTQRFLILDSRDRQPTSFSSTDCMFILNNAELRAVTSIELLHFCCPLTMYNINPTNNILYWNDVDGDHAVAITPGNYSIENLLIILKSTMEDASSVTFTPTYTDITMKIQIDGDSAFSFTFGTNTTNSAAYMLGFTNTDTTASTTNIGQKTINLAVPLYINIHVDSFTSMIKSSNSQDHPTFCCATSGIGSDVLLWSSSSYCRQITKCSRDDIQNLRVSLKSYGNRPIDLNDGDWSMLLHLNY